MLGDELDETNNPDVTNTRTYMWDVSDLDDPALIGSHDSTTTAIDHNQYVKGKYTYQSNYRAGLRILDITDIANGNLSEEAFFDVDPGSDSSNYDEGAWSNYPFFDSGIAIVSTIERGLHPQAEPCGRRQSGAFLSGGERDGADADLWGGAGREFDTGDAGLHDHGRGGE